MTVLGIIGRPLGHSQSKAYFERKFAAGGLRDRRFETFELARIEELDNVLARYGEELRGFCVTKPYKKDVMAWLDEISPEARAMGAVNCVRVEWPGDNPRLTGYNTDALGFRTGLESLLGDARDVRALVLGTGGASCAVRYVLEAAGIDYRMVSRTPAEGEMSYADLTPKVMLEHRLVVNTTPLGMFPRVEELPPISYEAIGAGHFLYDLIYNPAVTAFLAEGTRRGAKTQNGEEMFTAQAERNWEIWNA